ncbi:MAG: nitroreductase/quinone reductase family protein [Rubrobacter sp.]
MTAVETAQAGKPPPKFLMRVMNVVSRVMLRFPLHHAMSESVLLLTFNGRRSGKSYTTPMSYVREGSEISMSTEAPWWKNLGRGPDGPGNWR